MNNKKKDATNEASLKIDYKNVSLLKKYTSDSGKILPRRITMVTAKEQRKIAKAIKTARAMALMPYVAD